ncbi:FkbM family methyltransferase [uncultured Enterovirga sp.]|uniref:FkbM family methyltransferase n=1 Tax=uncultured Enterovirga sp. TaxID=2026352 RepID=UPI0035C9F9A1
MDIGTVIDVGTHAETPELKAAFPDKRHILFEPADDFFPSIHENYKGLDYHLAPVAVSNTDGFAQLKKISIDGQGVTHSGLVGPTTEGELTQVETVRLDTFMGRRDDPKPYLVKIDVDGFEPYVINGCDGIWDDIAVVIVEATQSTFADRLNLLTARGFTIFDIIDTCYYYDVFSQADLVMISPAVARLDALRPWDTRSFAWSEWVPVASYEGAVQA